jgi:hypothetical protein
VQSVSQESQNLAQKYTSTAHIFIYRLSSKLWI